MANPIRPCPCGSRKESYPLNDAKGIYCGRVCDKCVASRKAEFRPEIFRSYTEADVDEPIEPDW